MTNMNVEKGGRRAAFLRLFYQAAGGGIGGIYLRQFLLAVDIGLVDTVDSAAAGIAAAVAAVAGTAADAEGAADDLLPLGAGGVLYQNRLHFAGLPFCVRIGLACRGQPARSSIFPMNMP